MAKRNRSLERYVGDLCKRGHEYQNTGGTLRSAGQCIECKRIEGKERHRKNPEKNREAQKRFSDSITENYLGKPCYRNHLYGDTGKTLRGSDGTCVECKKIHAKRDRTVHKKARRARHQRYQENNPEFRKNAKLKYDHGVTLEEYNAKLEAQDYRCAVCGEAHFDDKKLHFDHCHTTGENRGLLCGNCNRALGLMGDSIDDLQSLIDYLKAY